jgi:hypothetical protein
LSTFVVSWNDAADDWAFSVVEKDVKAERIVKIVFTIA